MSTTIVELLDQMEKVEKDICNFPMVFVEMMKNEINANDEQEMYNSVKKLLRKHAKDAKAISLMEDFFGAISGDASLEEIMTIAIEEAQDPSLTSELTVDDSCRVKNNE